MVERWDLSILHSYQYWVAIAMSQPKPFIIPCLGVLFLYLVSYSIARVTVFHRVERYAGEALLGVEAKANPRQDYITERDTPPGEGWKYRFFIPMIKAEEEIIKFFFNR